MRSNQPFAAAFLRLALATAAIAAPVGETLAQPAGAPAPASRSAPPRRDNPATSIQDFVRLEGQSASPIRGVGLVNGLKGTGDSGGDLTLAFPLAEMYRNNGITIPDVKALSKSKSVALVNLWCEIPEEGGRKGDKFDVYVSVSHSASSLRGGMLLISPLLGPYRGDPVIAVASGPLEIEQTDVPTVARVRGGAQLIEDVRMRPPGNEFNLIVRPYFRSYSTTRMLASEINGITADLEAGPEAFEPIATAMDDMTVRVVVPEHERANPANFIASVLTKRFSPTLLDLPAQVIVNERTGNIIITGDVEISAVTVGSDLLTVTTIVPPPTPTPQDPLVTRSNVTDFGSTASNADRARIQDLLQAFRQLQVPARQQIQILAQIHASGRLHARFIRE
jgi:flagellar P-ring protein precursor FlgI